MKGEIASACGPKVEWMKTGSQRSMENVQTERSGENRLVTTTIVRWKAKAEPCHDKRKTKELVDFSGKKKGTK